MPRVLRLAVSAAALAASSAALHAQTPTPGTNTPNAGVPGTTPGIGLPVVGANGGETSASARGSRGGAVDSTIVPQLDSVNAAAKAGLTNLPPAAAASLVGSIQSKLAASSNPALRSIASDLAALQTELSASTVNGSRIGRILSRVGPKVTKVAGGQSGAAASTLTEIGSQLTAAGRQLTSGAASAPAGTR